MTERLSDSVVVMLWTESPALISVTAVIYLGSSTPVTEGGHFIQFSYIS